MGARALCAVAALGVTLAACTSEQVPPAATEASTAPRSTPPAGRHAPSSEPTQSPKENPSGGPARPRGPRDAPGTAPRAGVTRITLVGDVMLGRGVGAAGDPAAALRPLQRRLAAADITVGNLESTLSRAGAPRQGDDSFAAPPAVVPGLVDSGFDVLSLANNHTGDFGQAALLQTLRRVGRSPIAQVGAGRDVARAWRPVVLRRHGVRFGFVAFNAIGETPRATASAPGVASVRMRPRTGPLNTADLRRAERTVGALRRGRADVVVVLPHWGAQYTHVPVPAQRRVGRALVEAGADVVVGGHPHWVQQVQRVRRGDGGGLVVHSLGNYVFDMDFMRQTQEGVLCDLVFAVDRLRSVRFTPYVIGADFAPRVVRGPRARAILRPLGVPRVLPLGRR
jgi:poly-gamma-glutamate capsule biosynthesis protein CapA/YwtB (metallophosphatase superfamily)